MSMAGFEIAIRGLVQVEANDRLGAKISSQVNSNAAKNSKTPGVD